MLLKYDMRSPSEKFSLPAELVLLHQAHNFGRQVLGQGRPEKIISEDNDSWQEACVALASLYFILHPFSLPSSPPLLLPRHSQHLFTRSKCSSVDFIFSPFCAFVHFFPFSPLVGPAVENFRLQFSCHFSQTLLSHGSMEKQCTVPVLMLWFIS